MFGSTLYLYLSLNSMVFDMICYNNNNKNKNILEVSSCHMYLHVKLDTWYNMKFMTPLPSDKSKHA